jgi:hypothetical protein
MDVRIDQPGDDHAIAQVDGVVVWDRRAGLRRFR